MKCHWCQQDLQKILDEDDHWTGILECISIHCRVDTDLSTDQISGYLLYLDNEECGKIRYKIRGSKVGFPGDAGFVSVSTRVGENRKANYEQIMRFPKYIPLPIKDDVIQGKEFMQRIKKLLVFS